MPASLRRFRPFNGLTGYNTLFDITTIGTRFGMPSLALSPEEFEAEARAGMLDWLRLVLLDETSVATLAEASGWEWVHDGSRDCVRGADADDPLRTGSLADVVVPLVISTRPTRLSGEGEGNDHPPGSPGTAGRPGTRARGRRPAVTTRSSRLPPTAEPTI